MTDSLFATEEAGMARSDFRGFDASHLRAPARRDSPHMTIARCIGRSRGGLTTKIHALVDACGPGGLAVE
jgi:hypothetical protein